MENYFELLNRYRTTVIDLYELEGQLSHLGTDGRPAGYRGICFDMNCGTNDPAAASRQLAEGLENMIRHKRTELGQMASQLKPMLMQIPDLRTMTIIQRYYCFADTDENIAHTLRITTQRVNQLRHRFLSTLQAS